MGQSACKVSLRNGLKQTGVYLVENDKIIRANLRTTINNLSTNSTIKVRGESSYCDNYADEICEIKPNIVILSSFNKIKDGMQRIKQMQKEDTPDEEEFCTSVISGVKGYCRQSIKEDELFRVIHMVANNESYFDETMGNFIFRMIRHMGHLKQLPIDKPVEEQFDMSERELEVIKAAAITRTYKEVKMHLSKIYRKLGVDTKLEAILKMQSKIYEFKF